MDLIFHQPGNSIGNYNYNTRIYNRFTWGPHFHGNYELIYSISGKTKICVNGKTDFLHKGELMLIFPYTIHSLSVDSRSENWIGVFSDDHIPSFSEKNKTVRYSKFRCDEEIEAILKQNLFFDGTPERYMLCACLYMVCSQCVKNAVSYPIMLDSSFMQKVIVYISQNMNLNISLKDVSDALNYEYHYFSSLFHSCFSMNFKAFLNYFRFEKACKLLTSSDKSITDICNECGFGSIRNFNRVFKKLSNLTPGEYRNNFENTSPQAIT